MGDRMGGGQKFSKDRFGNLRACAYNEKGGSQKGGFQKQGFGRCSSVPKTGMRVQRAERRYEKPERGYKNRNDSTKTWNEGMYTYIYIYGDIYIYMYANTTLLQNRLFTLEMKKGICN